LAAYMISSDGDRKVIQASMESTPVIPATVPLIEARAFQGISDAAKAAQEAAKGAIVAGIKRDDSPSAQFVVPPFVEHAPQELLARGQNQPSK